LTPFHTVNAPQSRVDGAELELRAKVIDDLELRSLSVSGRRLTLEATGFVPVAFDSSLLKGGCAQPRDARLGAAPEFQAIAAADAQLPVVGDEHDAFDGAIV
jgi:hypothetical protein